MKIQSKNTNNFLALFWVAVLALPLASTTAVLAAPPGDLPFGVYDPEGGFSNDPDVQIEHLFLPWEDVFLESLLEADNYAVERGRAVLVTIEPWTWTRDERNSPPNLISGIANGDYDDNMVAICEVLSQFESPVTIRWAQEMEDRSGQFIWSDWDPQAYVDAYKRVVDVCRSATDQVEGVDFDYMWSPLGYDELAEFFPGEDYVDVIGLSVFGLQAWERDIIGKEQTFRDILTPRYERALTFNLPIVVAELGYVGDSEYVARWEKDVRQDLEGFPELQAVIYFNQQEVYPWPDGYGMPDWRVPNNILPDLTALAE
jgi:endoglucanase